MEPYNEVTIGDNHIVCANALQCYGRWEAPTVIVSDGPFGINGYKGDLPSVDGLGEWYEKHIIEWNKYVTPQTTLWFWNTELGWATVHPILVKYGWEFKCCNIWNKGIGHIAGNTNTKTLSRLPVVTEVCVQYVKKPLFDVNGMKMSMKEWLRYEWGRTKLPFSKTNEACGVADAATRKYFTKCHLWYMPPSDAFERIVDYANKYGDVSGKPFFSVDGEKPLTKNDWEKYRAKFHCEFGVTNVWTVPQLRSAERIKNGQKAVHLNQKPLSLVELILRMSSDKNDVVWDPFAGLCTTAIASHNLERKCYSAEMMKDVFNAAVQRVKDHSEIKT